MHRLEHDQAPVPRTGAWLYLPCEQASIKNLEWIDSGRVGEEVRQDGGPGEFNKSAALVQLPHWLR